MAKTVEYDISPKWNLAALINAAAGAKPGEAAYVFPEQFQIRMLIVCDEKGDLDNKLKKDPVFLQELYDAFNEPDGTVDKAKGVLVKKFGDALAAINGFVKAGRLEEAQKAFESYFSAQIFDLNAKELCTAIEKSAEAKWAKLVKAKSEYRRYKFKIVVSYGVLVGGLAVNIGVNVATIASAGFHFGAGIVLSAYGFVKTCIALSKLTADCFRGVDAAIDDAFNVLLNVQKKKDRGKVLGNAEILTETIANQVVGMLTAMPDFFDTVAKCEEKTTLARNKMNGTKVALHALGEKVQKAIEAQEKLQTKLAILQAADPGAKIPAKYRFDPKQLAKNQKKLDKLLEECTAAGEAFAKRDANLVKIEAALKELKKQKSSKATEGLRLATMGLLTLVALGAGLATVDFSSVPHLVSFGTEVGWVVLDKGSELGMAAMEKLHVDLVLNSAEFKASTKS